MKLQNKLFLMCFCLVALFAFAPKAMAATRTWNGNTSTAWNTAANWTNSEGGNSVPTASDDVVFADGAGTYTLNVGVDADPNPVCKSFDTTGTTNAVTVTQISGRNFGVYGNFTLKSIDAFNVSGLVVYDTSTLTQNGATLALPAGLTWNMSGTKKVTLGSNLSISGTLQIGRGGLDTSANNYSVNAGSIVDYGDSTAHFLTLNSSIVTCSNISFTGTNFTVTSTTHTINITSDSAAANNFAGKAWGIVNFKSNASAARAHAITPGSGATFVQFNIDQLTDRRDVSVSFGGDFSISQSSTWKSGGAGNDDPTYRMLIKSSVIGTTRTMTVSAASQTITMTDVDLQDIRVATTNTPTVTATRVGDAGGNSHTGTVGITDVSAPKTVYLDAGNAWGYSWNNNWSTQVGTPERNGSGLSLNNFPLPQDTAVIDNYSWDSAGQRIVLEGRVGNIDASGLTEADAINLAHSGVTDIATTIYGSILLTGSGVATFSNSTFVIFDARVKNELGTPAPLIINYGTDTGNSPYYVNSYGGTVQFASAIAHTSGTFTLTSGTLDLNGQTLTTNTFSSSNTNTRELKDVATGGKIVVTGLTGTIFDMSTNTGLTVNNAPVIDIGTSNLTQTGDVTFAGGGKTFGNFTITKHAGNFDTIITGANTFGTFTLETPNVTYQYAHVQFPAATTQTMTSFVSVGTASYQNQILSSTAATHTLSDAGGINTVQYTTITNSIVGGGAVWRSFLTDGNVDGGGNSGWYFSLGCGDLICNGSETHATCPADCPLTANSENSTQINSPLSGRFLDSSLVGYWSFDGPDTTWTSATAGTTNDLSGNSNTGTMTNMSRSTSPVAGINGQGLKFDGSTSRVDLGNNSTLQVQTFTISAWIKPSSLIGNQSIIGGTGDYSAIELSLSGPYLYLSKQGYGSIVNSGYPGLDNLANKFSLVTATYNSVTGVGNLYINGTYVNTGTNSQTFDNSAGLSIGKGITTTEPFGGTIDEVRIYNRALSATEISEQYRVGAAKMRVNTEAATPAGLSSGLVGYWSFDGANTAWSSATAGTTNDLSGNNNTGTMTNMSRSTSPTPGISGQGLKFDGVDDKVVSPVVNFLTARNTVHSVFAWINAISTVACQGIWNFGEYNDSDRGSGLGVLGGHLVWILNGCAVGSTVDSGLTVNANQWSFVGYVRTATDITFFVNNSTATISNSDSGAIGSDPHLIGATARNTTTEGFFNGKIDDVRIYNRALSASEVQELYQQGQRRVKIKAN